MKNILLLISCFLMACGSNSSQASKPSGSFPEGAIVIPYDNVPDRVRVTIYNDEKIVGEGDYVNGYREGAWTDYSPVTGLVMNVTNYLSGEKHGVSLSFHGRTSQLESKATYNQEQLEGQYLTFENRKVIEEKNYKQGQLNGAQKKYYSSGQVLEESQYQNGVIHGTARWYDEAGNLTIQYEYENGAFKEDTTPGK